MIQATRTALKLSTGTIRPPLMERSDGWLESGSGRSMSSPTAIHYKAESGSSHHRPVADRAVPQSTRPELRKRVP